MLTLQSKNRQASANVVGGGSGYGESEYSAEVEQEANQAQSLDV